MRTKSNSPVTSARPSDAATSPAGAAHDGDSILKAPEVCAIFRRSLPSLRRDWRAGRIPAPIRIGVRAMGWRRSDIEKHLASLEPEATPGQEAA